jgi:hypothetical protein
VEIVKARMAGKTQFTKNAFIIPTRSTTSLKSLIVPHLNTVYATDTFSSNVMYKDEYTTAQLYCEREKLFECCLRCDEKITVPGTLLDFFRKCGAMDGLYDDNEHVQTRYAVNEILRQYNIYDMQSESKMQHSSTQLNAEYKM